MSFRVLSIFLKAYEKESVSFYTSVSWKNSGTHDKFAMVYTADP